MTLPLERFRMLDLTRLVPGPMATWMLADLGMDVLKIEDVADRSAYRDQQAARRSRENFIANPEAREKELRANAWDHTHRNKKSIAINLQKPEGQAIFHRLVKDADVFFGSFRLGVYKRLGADYETLSQINPRLIYATISGYGFGNNFTEWPGNERNAQGMSGVSALMTGQDGEPADMLCQPVDAYSAALAVIAIQSALFAREQTGRGQRVDIALVEGGTAFVNANTPDYFRNKKVRQRGFPSIGNLRCKDGKYLSNAAFAQAHFWAPFCDAVGLPEMRDTVPAGNDEMIRKVKAHMRAKHATNGSRSYPRKFQWCRCSSSTKCSKARMPRNAVWCWSWIIRWKERYANWHRRSVCPTRRRPFAALRPRWANTASKCSKASDMARTRSAPSRRPA